MKIQMEISIPGTAIAILIYKVKTGRSLNNHTYHAREIMISKHEKTHHLMTEHMENVSLKTIFNKTYLIKKFKVSKQLTMERG
jgi:hypothetical protein